MSAWSTQIRLVGAGGEPVDLSRTLLSHGFVELPPMRLEEDIPRLELTLALNGKARTLEIAPGRRGHAQVTVLGRAPSARAADELVARVRHVLALDENLSDFYELVGDDPELSWTAVGAGRMLRAPSVFEDVIIFGSGSAGLTRVSAAGGDASPVTALDTSRREIRHAYPTFLADDRRFLYLRTSSSPEIFTVCQNEE